MTILIKGMEMPVTCCQCKEMVYNPEIKWEQAGKEEEGGWVCLLTGELIDNTKREEHCPLVEVPTPHGRLIDADELIKHDHQYYEYLSDDFYVLVRDIENAPTVIEAEE